MPRGRPYVLVFATVSLDGRLASPTGYSLLSCPEDFRLQHELRAWSDAVMVGANTALRDDPRLNVRLARGRSPLRVVVDSRLRVPPTARLFHAGRGVLVTVEGHPRERLRPYLERGVTVVEAGRGRVDLRRALEELAGLGVSRLMVEGGGTLICSLLREGLVDELRVTVAPTVFGGGVGLAHCSEPLAGGRGLRFALAEHRVLCGGWIHLRLIPAGEPGVVD